MTSDPRARHSGWSVAEHRNPRTPARIERATSEPYILRDRVHGFRRFCRNGGWWQRGAKIAVEWRASSAYWMV